MCVLHSGTKSVDVINETTELFSDEDEYKMADYGNEENVNIDSGGDSDEDMGSKGKEEEEEEEKENKSEDGCSSPCSPLDDSSLKRPNPFKVHRKSNSVYTVYLLAILQVPFVF